jgi:hypothetical protein
VDRPKAWCGRGRQPAAAAGGRRAAALKQFDSGTVAALDAAGGPYGGT